MQFSRHAPHFAGHGDHVSIHPVAASRMPWVAVHPAGQLAVDCAASTESSAPPRPCSRWERREVERAEVAAEQLFHLLLGDLDEPATHSALSRASRLRRSVDRLQGPLVLSRRHPTSICVSARS